MAGLTLLSAVRLLGAMGALDPAQWPKTCHVRPTHKCAGGLYESPSTASSCLADAITSCALDTSCIGVHTSGNGCSRVKCHKTEAAVGHCIHHRRRPKVRRRPSRTPSSYANCSGEMETRLGDYVGLPSALAIRHCKHRVSVSWVPSHSGTVFPQLHQWSSLVNATRCASAFLFARQQHNSRLDGHPRFAQIARVPWPTSTGDFREYALRGLPVIFTGAYPGSRIWTWSFERLRAELGALNVKVRHGNYISQRDEESLHTQMNLSSFIDVATGRVGRERFPGLPPYVGNNPLSHLMLRRLGYKSPPFYAGRPGVLGQPRLWVGDLGTSTPLHKDGTDNLVLQLHGVKRWTIFAPADLDLFDCARVPKPAHCSPATNHTRPMPCHGRHEVHPRPGGAQRPVLLAHARGCDAVRADSTWGPPHGVRSAPRRGLLPTSWLAPHRHEPRRNRDAEPVAQLRCAPAGIRPALEDSSL